MRKKRFENKYAGIALAALVSAAATFPAQASGARTEFNAAYSVLLPQDYDRVIAHFTDAMQTAELPSPESALAYQDRGAAYLAMGRDDEALADFDRALAINPSLPTAYNDRAIAFRHKGDLPEPSLIITRPSN